MPGNPDLRLALDVASELKIVSDYVARLAELKARYGHSITVLPDGKERMERFNCFAYALALWDKPDYVRLVDAAGNSAIMNSALIRAMINDGTLNELALSDASQGDVIVYFVEDKPTHAAVLASAGPPLVLRSKWGATKSISTDSGKCRRAMETALPRTERPPLQCVLSACAQNKTLPEALLATRSL